MAFNSNENKGLLWTLMYEGGVFTNINQTHLTKVKEMFENKINILHNSSGTVLEKNKRAMMEMIKDLESLRKTPVLRSNDDSDTMSNGNNTTERQYDIPVTANDIKSQRQEAFSSTLEKKQSEFTNMMSVKTPERPEFGDNQEEEKPIGEEMDKLLADMIAKRDLQLKNASSGQSSTKAQEWITKDNSNPTDFSNTLNTSTTTTSDPPVLKIGGEINDNIVPSVENIKIDVREEINKKHVSFKDDPVEPSFFERFKKTDRENNDIINDIKLLKSEITDKLTKLDELLYELH